jgi:CheY-like chemotaxis protein
MLAYAGRGKFVVAPVDLSVLLRDTGRLLHIAVSQHAMLNLDPAQSVPPINGDAAQLRQVVVSLVANASEALGDEPGVVRVRTGVIDADRELLRGAVLDHDLPEGRYGFVEVADTGRGMTAETLAKIFDPFFTTKFAGRGLGLAAVLGVVRSHKGAVRVQSRPGQGSTFQVLLPLASATESAGLRGRRLLLADDEDTVRLLAKLALEKAGYEVVTANDGRAAVELFRNTPDVAAVVLDLTMPRLGGLDALDELRRLDPHLRVLLVSGHSEHELAGRHGAAGFLQKPYTPTELVAAVGRVLAEAQA